MQHKTTKTLAAAVLALMLSTSAYAFEKPVLLQDQGSFFAGGTTVTTPGSFDFSNPLNPQGQTLHGDHAYVFYQKPVNAHKLPLVFLHGAGQSKKHGKRRRTDAMVFKISFWNAAMPPTL